MKTVGVICEYNPLHLGHVHHFQTIRKRYGADSRIVCLMSGNYVQRGSPAILNKQLRAQAAICAGANLVLELPVNVCLSSAEGYASGGVAIADQICDTLSFGAESMTEETLMDTAQVLCSEDFSVAIKRAIAEGISFPAARQKALEQMGGERNIPIHPNDILAAEYCKAIVRMGSHLEIYPIIRQANYHSQSWEYHFPSASAVRSRMLSGEEWVHAVPECARELFQNAELHNIYFGEAAILYRLRTMTEDDFAALPYGSEGLWRRFFHACHSSAGLDEIIENTKTKRYTRTRIDRMIMCAFLGITEERLLSPAPYIRILAFDDQGRKLLAERKGQLSLLNAGEKADNVFWELEQRYSDLYGLFAKYPEKPGQASMERIFYNQDYR